MPGAILILIVTIAIGVILWAWERFRTQRHGSSLHHHVANGEESRVESEESRVKGQESRTKSRGSRSDGKGTTENAICCGLHAICEKTGQINEPPIYYDDEELDRFAGRPASDYTDEETEEFRDVLLTLPPSDAPGWAVSLEKRRINLPADLKPELELLLSEV